MPFLTAGQISRLSIALMSRRLVLPRTASMVPQDEFRGSNGDTVTVRVPAARTPQIQATPGDLITMTAIDEDSADVTVAQVYDAAPITDHDLSLNIENYGRQVLNPMTATVARGAEDQLAGVMNSLAADASFAATADPDDTEAMILRAAEELDDADVDPDGRWMAVSPAIATRVLSVPKFVRVNESGSSQALRRGIIGDLYGFTFVKSNGLDAGTALGYHRSGFGFATFPTVEAPGGDGDQSAVVTEQGISLRTIRQWNPSRLQREQVVTCFAGAGLVDADRVFKLDTL